jgi:hypothetical protein
LDTVYDWVTVGIFACLIVLFLQRSSQPEPQDKLYQYLPPAIGCAITNYLGNEGYVIAAVATIGAAVGYVLLVLKPFDTKTDSQD